MSANERRKERGPATSQAAEAVIDHFPAAQSTHMFSRECFPAVQLEQTAAPLSETLPPEQATQLPTSVAPRLGWKLPSLQGLGSFNSAESQKKPR